MRNPLLLLAATPLVLAACAEPEPLATSDDPSVVTSRTPARPLLDLADPDAPTGNLDMRRPGPGVQCDAVGRTVQVPLRMSSTRGHVGGHNQAVYSHLVGGGWSQATNVNDRTAGTCNADEMKSHEAEVTIPVAIKCVAYVPQLGGQPDPSKPCQPEIEFGIPAFGAGGPTKFKSSNFTGTYSLGKRWQRITDGLGSAGREEVEDFIRRTSSCFHHAGSTTGAHSCATKAETVRSQAPVAPLDIDRGTRHFTVGLGAMFVHSLHAPNEWNLVFGGGWAGLSYGPVSVGAQANAIPPNSDESSGWNGWTYTVQCGVDGKPYLMDRVQVGASNNATNLSFDLVGDPGTADRKCSALVDRINRLLPDFAGHGDLLAELHLLRSRARTRDLDCADGDTKVSALIRNKAARGRASDLRGQYGNLPNAAQVVAAIAALEAWLRSPEGLYAPEPALGNLLRAIDAAIANFDLVATLRALQRLYPAGELASFDTAVTELLTYLLGPGPIDQAQVAAKYKVVQDRLAELLRNRVCRTNALSALDRDQARMLENVENREPYAARVRELVAAARTAVGVRTMTCAQVAATTAALQNDLTRVFINMRGEKLVAALKALNGPGCQVTGRAAFGQACDAMITQLRAITFADRPSFQTAYDALLATKRRLCEPAAPPPDLPPVVVPPDTSLPPVVVPIPGGDGTSDDVDLDRLEGDRADDAMEDFEVQTDGLDDAALDAMVTADDLGEPDAADIELMMFLPADAALWTDADAPWFDGDWQRAQLAADLVRELIAAWPDAPVGVSELPGEICDLHHEPPFWTDRCTGCVNCSGDTCLSEAEAEACDLATSPDDLEASPATAPDATSAPVESPLESPLAIKAEEAWPSI